MRETNKKAPIGLGAFELRVYFVLLVNRGRHHLGFDDAALDKLVEPLEVREVLVTGADLDLDIVWFKVTIVKTRPLREHGDNAYTRLSALHKGGDVVEHCMPLPIADIRSADKTGTTVIADSTRPEKFTATFRALIQPAMSQCSITWVRLEFWIELTKPKGGPCHTVAENGETTVTFPADDNSSPST